MLTPDKLEVVKVCQQNQNYISIDSADEVKNGASKPEIKDCLPFCCYFEYGANNEGY